MSKRIYGLDVLRALAILEVVYAHSFRFTDQRLYFLYDGVGVFFVLSGYLIGGILLKTINETPFKGWDLVRFWVKRWLRTLPAYYSVLILLVFYQGIRGHKLPDLLPYFTFTQSFTDGESPYFYGESWSLCIEEWFYLVVPFVFYITLSYVPDKKKVMLFWSLFIIIAVTIFRIIYVQYIPAEHFERLIYKATITRFDNIMYGVLGACLCYYKHPVWNKKNLFFSISILIYIVVAIHHNFFAVDFFTLYFEQILQALAALMLLPKLTSITTGKGIVFRSLTFISIISYSIYLLNFTPFTYFRWRIDIMFNIEGNALDFILYLAFTFCGAYLLYCFVERPFMNLRERISFRKMQLALKKTRNLEIPA